MNRPIDVHGILARAGANPDAAEGTQAWALAQVDEVVSGLWDAAAALRAAQRDYMANRGDESRGKVVAQRAAELDGVLACFGSAP